MKLATDKTKAWFIGEITKSGDSDRQVATKYCIELGWLLPNETLEDMELRFVPISQKQLESFRQCMGLWMKDGKVNNTYLPNQHDGPKKKPIEVPRDDAPEPEDDNPASEEPWYGQIVPVPHKGQKRDDYLKNPDYIGSLYDARHDDEEARKRLWGFVNHYEPKGWVKRDGTQMPPSASDIQFRKMLDAFAEWFEKNHPEEKL
jgi:hypothetical protein